MHLDETEDIEVVKVPLSEVKQMLDKDEIITSSEEIALLHYFLYENEKQSKKYIYEYNQYLEKIR